MSNGLSTTLRGLHWTPIPGKKSTSQRTAKGATSKKQTTTSSGIKSYSYWGLPFLATNESHNDHKEASSMRAISQRPSPKSSPRQC